MERERRDVDTASMSCPTTSSSGAAEGVRLRAASVDDVRRGGGRIHLELQGRFVTIFRREENGEVVLNCIDSICYHAGGPLTVSDIEDIDGRACVRCPWHNYLVTVDTGEKLYQKLVMTQDGKMVPGVWESVGVRQRVHRADEIDGAIWVTLDSTGDIESDKYATNQACGARMLSGRLGRTDGRAGGARGGMGISKAKAGAGRNPFHLGSMMGSDGKMPRM